MRVLVEAVSQETAYVQPDYPYSFRLRCERRCWIETKKGHGYRFVTQTSNPKRPGMWNKPKAGVYHTLALLTLTEEGENAGHVDIHVASFYDGVEKLDAFEARFGEHFTETNRKTMQLLRAADRASKRVTYTIVEPSAEGEEAEPPQTREEQSRMFRSVVLDELRKGDPGCGHKECLETPELRAACEESKPT